MTLNVGLRYRLSDTYSPPTRLAKHDSNMKKLLISLTLCGLVAACNTTRGVADSSAPSSGECSMEATSCEAKTECSEAMKAECAESKKSECSEAKVCPVTGAVN